MSLNYYLVRLQYETILDEFLTVFDEVDEEDLKGFLKGFKELNGEANLTEEDITFKFAELSILSHEKTVESKKGLNISPLTEQTLREFYRYNYRIFNLGFETPEDFEQYNEDLFNLLRGERAKNFRPLEDRADIFGLYYEVIAERVFNDLKTVELDFLDKFRIIWRFLDEFEGLRGASDFVELQPDGVYNCLFEAKTFGELFNRLTDWYEDFIRVPWNSSIPKDKTTFVLVFDCIDWRFY